MNADYLWFFVFNYPRLSAEICVPKIIILKSITQVSHPLSLFLVIDFLHKVLEPWRSLKEHTNKYYPKDGNGNHCIHDSEKD